MYAIVSLMLLALAAPPNCPGGVCPNPSMGIEAGQHLAPATLRFAVTPADGQVWIGHQQMTGHDVKTRPLATGRYSYEAKARWLRDGRWIERTIVTPTFAAGEVVHVPISLPGEQPTAVVEGATVEQGGTNFGIDHECFQGGVAESYSINGMPVSRQTAKAAVGQGSLRDDRKNLHLTIAGPKEFTQGVLEDLGKSPLREYQDRLRVQSYTPDAWALKEAGFPAGNQICLQGPDGTVLHRQSDYTGGAEKLIQAIRKADANYRPDRDPDLRHDEPNLWLYLGLAAAAFVLLRPSA